MIRQRVTHEHHTGVLPTPPAWMRQAACNPEPGEKEEVSRARMALFDCEDERDHARNVKALSYCHRCPVMDICLEAGLARKDEWVILGGTTPSQRKEILRKRREAAKAARQPTPQPVAA